MNLITTCIASIHINGLPDVSTKLERTGEWAYLVDEASCERVLYDVIEGDVLLFYKEGKLIDKKTISFQVTFKPASTEGKGERG